MADDFMTNPAATGAAGVVITAVLAWLGQRMVGKAALEAALRETTKEILAQLRQELKVALKQRDEAREENAELRAQIEELHATIGAFELRVAAGVIPRPSADF